jgi:hypothetical protein
MLADNVWQSMSELAAFLHPDPATAGAVTLDAADWLVLLQRLRESPTGHTWRRLPEAWLPQYCVYLASDGPERAHERRRPHRAPPERPTRDDSLLRYVKCLVWWTLDRSACHVAVALGCLLYCYPPEALVRLAPALCAPHQVHRIRVRLVSQLQARFPRAHFFAGDHGTRRLRLPTVHDRQLVQRALTRFTPWGAVHVPAPALDHSLLETHFARASVCSDWDRIHALINPADAGVPRLIREYNEPFLIGDPQRLAEPTTVLTIPRFVP